MFFAINADCVATELSTTAVIGTDELAHVIVTVTAQVNAAHAVDTSVQLVGNVTFVAPVLVSVIEFAQDVANVDQSARVNVALVAGAVIATLFIEVAVATHRTGVTSVGVFANTNAPDHVSSEITQASSLEVVDANTESLFAVRAIVPVRSGNVYV